MSGKELVHCLVFASCLVQRILVERWHDDLREHFRKRKAGGMLFEHRLICFYGVFSFVLLLNIDVLLLFPHFLQALLDFRARWYAEKLATSRQVQLSMWDTKRQAATGG